MYVQRITVTRSTPELSELEYLISRVNTLRFVAVLFYM